MTEMDVRYYMMFDHQETNDLISNIISSTGKVDETITGKIDNMLRDHIYLEETLLFPLLPGKFSDEVDYLEMEHGKIFGILTNIKKEENTSAIRKLFSDLLGILTEHNSYEESFIYDLYESLEIGILENVPERPKHWKCRFQ